MRVGEKSEMHVVVVVLVFVVVSLLFLLFLLSLSFWVLNIVGELLLLHCWSREWWL